MRHVFGLFLALALSTGLAIICAAASTNNGDEAAVIEVLNHFVDGWNRHDMDALASVFSEDADFVNVIGQRWIGRKAIEDAHAANHETIFSRASSRLKRAQ